MDCVIEMKNLCREYKTARGKIDALKNVNLKIKRGEITAILGESGSGKSTLMNIMGCLDAPTDGEYLLCGENVATASDGNLSKIRNRDLGFIFQSFNLISGLTAFENTELPLIYRHCKKEERIRRVQKALLDVGLGNRMYHKPYELSGGQQQRVAVARAIASAPPVILADEPTGNLDVSSRNDVMQSLLSLWRDGHTVIIITHDSAVADMCGRIINIKGGEVISDNRR